jgi:hypothetical protein
MCVGRRGICCIASRGVALRASSHQPADQVLATFPSAQKAPRSTAGPPPLRRRRHRRRRRRRRLPSHGQGLRALGLIPEISTICSRGTHRPPSRPSYLAGPRLFFLPYSLHTLLLILRTPPHHHRHPRPSRHRHPSHAYGTGTGSAFPPPHRALFFHSFFLDARRATATPACSLSTLLSLSHPTTVLTLSPTAEEPRFPRFPFACAQMVLVLSSRLCAAVGVAVPFLSWEIPGPEGQ